jgi:hypothetical protein
MGQKHVEMWKHNEVKNRASCWCII